MAEPARRDRSGTGPSAVWDRLAERTPPLLALGLAVVAISTSAILIRESAAPSIIKAFYRVFFTTVLLAPWAIVSYRDAFRSLSIRDLSLAGLTGVVLSLHFTAWFESLEWTSVAASVTLVQSQPLFVVVGSYLLLNERVTRLTVAGILVALLGMGVMMLPGAEVVGADPLYGNLLAAIGAVMAAGYVLAGRSLRQRVALIPYVVIVYGVCAGSLLAFAAVEGATVPLSAYPPREWALFVAMAVGPGIFGHTVINWSLKHLESTVVSVALLGEPIGSTVLAIVLFGEVPDAGTVVGGAVVLVGIYVTIRARASGT